MLGKNEEIFKGKTFSGLLEDIYKNTKNKQTQINVLISELKPLIKNIADAGLLVPLIAEYVKIGVENDEILVKMAAVIQRAFAAQNKNIESGDYNIVLSEQEKSLILDQVKQLKSNIDSNEIDIKKIDIVKEKISNTDIDNKE